MYLDIELSKEELRRLEKGGFMTLSFPDGVRIAITKDILDEEEEDE